MTFALHLGLPIPRLAGREAGGKQHQPHLCGDEKPLWSLQGTPGRRERNWCPNSGGHADPKVNEGLECGGRSVNSPTLGVGRTRGGVDYSPVLFWWKISVLSNLPSSVYLYKECKRGISFNLKKNLGNVNSHFPDDEMETPGSRREGGWGREKDGTLWWGRTT